MTGFLATALRTDAAGALRDSDVGRRVVLCGWVHRRRDHGGVLFFDLRDRWGWVQCVADPEALDPAQSEVVAGLRAEDVVRVEGIVRQRPAGSANADLATGAVEVAVSGCRVLGPAATPPFPIDVEKEGGEVSEELRLRYRFLELRRPGLAAAFGMRHRLMLETRRYFDELGFWEVETPMLTRRTPEGARDYLVPSRVHPGEFYALPQSPQLYKQLLMVAGFDRYFQIARCFRDEDLRADRQPEFTQIDVEMSFVEQDDVLRVIEGLFRHLFQACLGVEIGTLPRLTHAEALARYGSDKPDLRIARELVDLSGHFGDTGFRVFDRTLATGGCVVGLVVPQAAGVSRGQLDRWTEAARSAGAPGLVWGRHGADGWTSSVDKFVDRSRWEAAAAEAGAGPGDLILAVAGPPRVAHIAMGALRLHIGVERNWIEDAWRPLWVVDFPLFEVEDDGTLVPSHHPFTAPAGGLEALDAEDPLTIHARAYDLVLNGYELGSGSIRIHQRAVQERVFELLGLDRHEAERKFGFLLGAFEYGAPPHGGFAVGFDRTAMLFSGGTSLREVIVFPKTTRAAGLMEGAPSPVPDEELAELHVARRVPPDGAGRDASRRARRAA